MSENVARPSVLSHEDEGRPHRRVEIVGVDPRRVSVPLLTACPGIRLVLGTVDVIDLDTRQVGFVDPEGQRRAIGYDRLQLTAGSVNKLLPIPERPGTRTGRPPPALHPVG